MGRLKVLFVVDRIGFTEIISVPSLSAILKSAGHEVELIEFGAGESEALRRIEANPPHILAYSICSTEAERFLHINDRIKTRTDCFSVFGGPHPTFFPDFIYQQGVDAICQGEGDSALPRFLDCLGSEAMFETPNFSIKLPDGNVRENPVGDLIENLDSLPFPDRDIVYSKNKFLAGSPIKSFFAGRGCPFKCTYCFNHAYHELYRGKGHVVRTKSVSYLMEELASVGSRYPLSFVKFQDDVFGLKRSWLEEFCVTYPKKIGLPFLCYARPNMVTNDYARLLKEAGCYSVCMAIESGSEAIRRNVLNRQMGDERIIDAAAILKRHGMRLYIVNMIGLPNETEQDMIRTVNLNSAVGSDFSDASIFQPYPGTHIEHYCKEIGLLGEGQATFESQFTSSILNLPPDFKAKVETLHRLFSIMVDFPWVRRFYPALAKMPWLKPLLNFVYRFYYGVNLHRRIYAGKIPFSLRLRAALPLLFSRNRT
ncbi:MAG: cobalamin B12-binding domain-containing protein [Desulfomonile tiedjei]|nr:cobalamin B12-binding domain-containing protein [Desulfomonile tiedjei]